ncbi:hypothetical protein BST27_14245 [Mycobacterium intermedium]|uniref:Uncharacterized protein n=1 Tax=Mycobacterium intermedium TaxID=28445 RepID=A0A1E3S9I3_MYCIE|nr:hypothetical protein BHQ20_20355 [Mycobacterium intermedium]OPE49857.1 hypothetical protein BV508_12490 [Mycobacterium intermedium]ORB04683.1 hypothetical protein BST27_14245 [Mycobacterium intermedium]
MSTSEPYRLRPFGTGGRRKMLQNDWHAAEYVLKKRHRTGLSPGGDLAFTFPRAITRLMCKHRCQTDDEYSRERDTR